MSETAGAVTPRETIAERVARIAAQRAAEAAATPDILSPEQLAAAGFILDSTAQQRVAARLASDAVAAYTRDQRKAADISTRELRILERLRGSLYCGAEVLDIPKPHALVSGILDMDSLVILYGPTQSGKSFIGLDILLSVTNGFKWQGQDVRQGRGLYIAAEGTGDLSDRVAAWQSQFRSSSLDDADFLTMPVNLFDEAAVRALSQIVVRGEYVFIVIDTLARSMVGADENSAKDAAVIIEAAFALQAIAGACVMLVHHSGYDATHARGSTAFKSASDVELSVKRTPDGLVILKSEKQKTRADGDKWFLKLEARESSLVVERAHDKPEAITVNALDALKSLADNDDDTGLTIGQWRAVMEGSTASTFFRQRKQLDEKRLIAHVGKGSSARYSVTDEGRAALPAPVLHVVHDEDET